MAEDNSELLNTLMGMLGDNPEDSGGPVVAWRWR